MKKTILLVILALFVLSSPVLAADRWVFLTSSEEPEVINVHLDSQRIRSYGKKEDPYLDCWMKWSSEKGETRKEHVFVQVNTLKFMVREGYFSSKDGEGRTYNKENEGWKEPLPDTLRESALINAIEWAKQHGY